MAKRSHASKSPAKGLGRLIALGLIAVGMVVLAVGLWWVYNAFSPGDAAAADRAAQNSIDRIGTRLAEVEEAMAAPAVMDAARAALSDEAMGTDGLRQQLQAAGVPNVIDARVFGPDIESIEIGQYPEPNYAVVQMLLSARRQGAAPAEVHYPGSANENLAFALSVPLADGEPGEVAGYLFVRLPVSTVTRRLVDPGAGGWLALQQGQTVIASSGTGAGQGPSDGQATIAGSQLRMHWAGARASGPGPTVSGAVAGIGFVLALLGFVTLRKAGDPSVVAEPPEPAKPAPTESRRSDAAAKAGTPREAAEPATGDQQDLPDWMLDEAAGGDDDDGPFEQPDRPRKRSSEEESLDVPDLDEIYEQIESGDSDESEDEPEAAEQAPSASGGQAEAEDLLELEDFDFTRDSIEPDEDDDAPSLDDDSLVEEEDFDDDFEPERQPEVEAEPEQETGSMDRAVGDEEDGEEAAPALDPDFEFSDARKGDEAGEPDSPSSEEAAAESEASSFESPDDSGLELAVEDEGSADESVEESSSESDDEDVFRLESGLEPEPGSEAPLDSESDAAAEAVPPSGSQTETPPASIGSLPDGVFRHHDILGVADDELDAPTSTAIGQSIGSLAAERGFSRMAVARDGRFSGPVLLSALIRGLRDAGMDVVEIGAVPTPLLWFAAMELADGCGVMVTASHHPPEYNGFRAMLGGDFLGPEDLAELHRLFEAKAFAEGEGTYEQQDVRRQYAKRLTTDIQLERPLKMVVDCGNGVGGAVVPKLLQAVGAEVIPLYCDVDGAFPNHRPDPSSADQLEDLRLCVRNFQAELGIAFDGDADRLVMVTRNGEIVWPDRLLMLLAEEVLAARPDEGVVFDARCSGHLLGVVERAGGRGIMTAAGHHAVAQRLKRESAPLGGDMDGHLFIHDRWYSFDDAVYAAARLLEVLAADTRPVDEILAEQPEFRASPEIVVEVDREQAGSIVERLGRETAFDDGQVAQVDGVRVDWPDRWGLARIDTDSGRLVLRFGADDANALGRVRRDFRKKLLELEPELPLPY